MARARTVLPNRRSRLPAVRGRTTPLHNSTSSPQTQPARTRSITTASKPLHMQRFIHADNAVSINESCLPDDSPKRFLQRREDKFANHETTSDSCLIRCVNTLPDPRGPQPYKLFVWQWDIRTERYRRLQIPPFQCYRVFSYLQPCNCWMDTKIREIDAWPGFRFKSDSEPEAQEDEINPLEMERDPLTTEHFHDVVSLAKDFFGFRATSPAEYDEIPPLEILSALEALSTAAILRQIGMNDKKLHERGFSSASQFISFVHFFGSTLGRTRHPLLA